jgi:hypothetical protein
LISDAVAAQVLRERNAKGIKRRRRQLKTAKGAGVKGKGKK